MSTETEKMKERYAKRKADQRVVVHGQASSFIRYSSEEREAIFLNFIKKYLGEPSSIRVLEIGAGGGGNISFFKKIGVPASQIVANELLDDRVELLRERHPDITIIPGDATVMKAEEIGKFDVVFQSTVFTSILDTNFQSVLANSMMGLLNESGMLLWYDFVYNNPNNPDVRKVTIDQVKQLFPELDFKFKKVTLAPPIGRRVGPFYPVFNALPFLRTHIIGAGLRH